MRWQAIISSCFTNNCSCSEWLSNPGWNSEWQNICSIPFILLLPNLFSSYLCKTAAIIGLHFSCQTINTIIGLRSWQQNEHSNGQHICCHKNGEKCTQISLFDINRQSKMTSKLTSFWCCTKCIQCRFPNNWILNST